MTEYCEDFDVLKSDSKRGAYKSLILIYPVTSCDLSVANANLNATKFGDVLRYCINNVSWNGQKRLGSNTRCLVENASALPYAKEFVGKNRNSVVFKVVHENVLDDFIKTFNDSRRVILIPSELSLEDLDAEYKHEGKVSGIDSESINDFMKFWHYAPPLRVRKQVDQKDVTLSMADLLILDPMAYRKLMKKSSSMYSNNSIDFQ